MPDPKLPKELADLLAQQPKLPETPTMGERWASAIPLIVIMLSASLCLRATSEYWESYRVLQLPLPYLTVLALKILFFLRDFPWALSILLFAVWWVYLSWVCTNRDRLKVFGRLSSILLLLSVFILPVIPVLPFLRIQCLKEGTRVATPEGARAIQDLRTGDSVWSINAQGHREVAQVVSSYVDGSSGFLHITLENGQWFNATPTHPIATSTGWSEAGELKPGDELATESGSVRVAGIHRRAHAVRVYDLTVEPNSNFFANGVLVHNKMRKK
ncbi:MAG: Hint domain-containing protein [Planctomycetota bacterium]|nr:Hint domain-containing protein [Planctomycetota bacterium]